MSAPRFADCKCGHNKMSHEVEEAPFCCHDDCDCTGYVVGTRTGPARGTVPPSLRPVGRATASDLIEDGKASGAKRIVALAVKVEGLLADLAKMLRDDSAARAVRAEVADLERRLAAAKSKLRPAGSGKGNSAPTQRGPVYGDYPCAADGCTFVSTTSQGRAAHTRHNHKASA